MSITTRILDKAKITGLVAAIGLSSMIGCSKQPEGMKPGTKKEYSTKSGHAVVKRAKDNNENGITDEIVSTTYNDLEKNESDIKSVETKIFYKGDNLIQDFSSYKDNEGLHFTEQILKRDGNELKKYLERTYHNNDGGARTVIQSSLGTCMIRVFFDDAGTMRYRMYDFDKEKTNFVQTSLDALLKKYAMLREFPLAYPAKVEYNLPKIMKLSEEYK